MYNEYLGQEMQDTEAMEKMPDAWFFLAYMDAKSRGKVVAISASRSEIFEYVNSHLEQVGVNLGICNGYVIQKEYAEYRKLRRVGYVG